MQPLVKASAAIAILAGLSNAAERHASARAGQSPGDVNTPERASLPALCPPGTLPDANVCIPVPTTIAGHDSLDAEQGTHRDRGGSWRVYDHLPRRPERPADYRKYRYPVTPVPGQNLVASGYDLDMPDSHQRRGENLKAVGHGGLDLAQKRGTEVRLVNLEHQVGEADVVFVGALFGNSVVTRHSIREAGRLREYVVIHGHLDGPAPGLGKGTTVREGSLVGFVGDSGSPGDVHLHLEIRRVRAGVDVASLPPNKIARSAYTVVCDPRNVLPLG